MMRHYATFYPYDLDLGLIEEAIQDLVGTHDFTGFTASGTSVEDKVRTITAATMEYDQRRQFLILPFQAMAFVQAGAKYGRDPLENWEWSHACGAD